MELNKKGNLTGTLAIVVVFFALVVGFFLMRFFTVTITDTMQENPIINATNGTQEAFQASVDISNRFDYIAFVILIGLLLALAITGYFVGGYPIFMFFYFIGLAIVIIISVLLSNVWDTISNLVIFGNNINAFPLTNHILSNFAVYAAIFGFIGVIAMFGKKFTEGF